MKYTSYLPLLCLLLASCSDKPDGAFAAIKTGQCSTAQSLEASTGFAAGDSTPFFPQDKVRLDQWIAEPEDGIVTPSADLKLPQGTGLGVVMKDSCLTIDGQLDSTRAGAIARQLDISGRLPTPSGEQAYEWTLPRGLTVGELRSMATSDACIIGVTENAVETLDDHALEYVDAPEVWGDQVQVAFNDPMYASQGHMKMLQASTAYDTLYDSSKGIAKASVIAVIDTGIDMKHPDLKTRLWVNKGEIAGNGKDDDGNGYVDDVYGYNFPGRKASPNYETGGALYHHGTHVAGLAIAQSFNGVGISGVMGWGATTMTLNVFGKNSGASRTDIANAIRYAADNGAHVINMSLGGTGKSALYESSISYAISKGVTVVAAAGNSSRSISTSYFAVPAAYARQFAGMMAIGSVDSSDLRISRFSNYNPDYVEIAAPGSERSYSGYGLLSTMPNNRYARIQGTSMATPVAAGAAALASAMLRTRGYSALPARIETVLRGSSRKVSALTPYFNQGNVLNLQNLAEFIVKNYPDRRGTNGTGGSTGGDSGGNTGTPGGSDSGGGTPAPQAPGNNSSSGSTPPC